jgi:hypothetical protein
MKLPPKVGVEGGRRERETVWSRELPFFLFWWVRTGKDPPLLGAFNRKHIKIKNKKDKSFLKKLKHEPG